MSATCQKHPRIRLKLAVPIDPGAVTERARESGISESRVLLEIAGGVERAVLLACLGQAAARTSGLAVTVRVEGVD
jgi:hypothetical protein